MTIVRITYQENYKPWHTGSAQALPGSLQAPFNQAGFPRKKN